MPPPVILLTTHIHICGLAYFVLCILYSHFWPFAFSYFLWFLVLSLFFLQSYGLLDFERKRQQLASVSNITFKILLMLATSADVLRWNALPQYSYDTCRLRDTDLLKGIPNRIVHIHTSKQILSNIDNVHVSEYIHLSFKFCFPCC